MKKKTSGNSVDLNNQGTTENISDYQKEGNDSVYLNSNNVGFRF